MELSGVSAELSHTQTEGRPASHQHAQLRQQQGCRTPGKGDEEMKKQLSEQLPWCCTELSGLRSQHNREI